MRNKLIILVESYFQQRDYRRYGIEILQANGFEVQVWEVFRLWNPIYSDSYTPPDPAQFFGLRHFTRTEDVIRTLSQFGADTAVIVPFSERWETKSIYRQLARQRAFYGTLAMGGTNPQGRGRRFQLGTWRTWRDRIYRRMPRTVRGTSPPNFILLCGGTSLEPLTWRFPRSEPVWTHALDYDIVLSLATDAGLPPGRHIVFLDEYVPFHPDYISLNISAPNKPDEYFPKLNALFDSLEKLLRVPVVVAAHPRANYKDGASYFGARRIVLGQTGALVKDAALVVTHCSTSNSFTAIFRKPLLVVTTKGLSESYYGPDIRSMAEYFNAKLVNLDEGWHLTATDFLPVNETRYASLVDAYVKRPGTPEKNTWEILSRYLRGRPLV